MFQEQFRGRPAYVEQYGQPIDASRVGRFADELSASDIAAVSELCDSILSTHYPELLSAAGR
ncbi:MAG: hypothetical protein AAF823_15215 [Planctomycetota bacterium]